MPQAVIAKRVGGVLEATAESLAGGARTDLGEAWRWARVSGGADPAWFTDARAAGLGAMVEPAEEVWLHGRVLVFTRPAEAHPALLRDAEALSDALVEAIG